LIRLINQSHSVSKVDSRWQRNVHLWPRRRNIRQRYIRCCLPKVARVEQTTLDGDDQTRHPVTTWPEIANRFCQADSRDTRTETLDRPRGNRK